MKSTQPEDCSTCHWAHIFPEKAVECMIQVGALPMWMFRGSETCTCGCGRIIFPEEFRPCETWKARESDEADLMYEKQRKASRDPQ